ncbi:hypothetical protein QTP88_014490 [Uroleucon formosanum]
MAHPSSIYPQKVNIDLASAVKTANNLSSLIREVRGNVRTAEQLAKEIGEKIEIPRVTQLQQKISIGYAACEMRP